MENIIYLNNDALHILDIETSRNSGGRLNKLWVHSESLNDRLLVKGNTLLGYESISEVMAYKIGVILGINVLEYSLLPYKPFENYINSSLCKYVCICRNLNTGGNKVTSITSIKDYLNIYNNRDVPFTNREVMENTLSREYIDKMLLFDAIIGNTDRHYRNVHVLRKSTGEYVECPLIDNGASLLALSYTLGINTDKSYTLAKTHSEQVKYIKTKPKISLSEIETLYNTIIAAINSELSQLHYTRALAIKMYLRKRLIKFLS